MALNAISNLVTCKFIYPNLASPFNSKLMYITANEQFLLGHLIGISKLILSKTELLILHSKPVPLPIFPLAVPGNVQPSNCYNKSLVFILESSLLPYVRANSEPSISSTVPANHISNLTSFTTSPATSLS